MDGGEKKGEGKIKEYLKKTLLGVWVKFQRNWYYSFW